MPQEPNVNASVLPGKEGTDYHFVNYGGQVYVVYRVKLADGKWVNTTWRVDKEDYKALGVNPSKVRKIARPAFRALNVFGSSSEIAKSGSDEHPFQTYMKHLREVNGQVSWLGDKQFMSVMLMGWAENWSAEELRQRLTRTSWYKSRTDYQRQWELETAPGQRDAEKNVWETRMMGALEDLYGPNTSLKEAGFNKDTFANNVDKLASGKWGAPADGFEVWLQGERERAEKIEGTTAWMEKQQALEEQRAFMNRPEDVAEQLRQQATEWLGPRGVPDQQTLSNWASRLVSEKASDADWETYLRTQAKNLYPYLGTEERWQDRASAYKNIAEQELGRTLTWDDDLLYSIGEKGTDGAPTGAAMNYDAYTRLVRSQDEWWKTSNAASEGFDLFNALNNTFQGVQ